MMDLVLDNDCPYGTTEPVPANEPLLLETVSMNVERSLGLGIKLSWAS